MIVAGKGVELAVRTWAGIGAPTLALSHATGFCKEVWVPVVEELRLLGNDLPIVAWDHRSHGGSERSALPIDWWDVAEDTLAIVDFISGPVVGVGHSLGAAAIIMADMLRAGSWDLIVAIEPAIFPPPYGPAEDHPLAVTARRRRDLFDDPAQARTNYASKEVFAGWDARALDGYVDGGLRPVAERWELACPPEHEASFFAESVVHGAWARLGEVRSPVVLVTGSDSDTHSGALGVEQEARMRPQATIVVEAAGHFLPMEDPARVAAVIDQALKDSITSS